MTADELTCRELVELVTDYLEGALPPEERARFDAHLERCDGCRLYLEQVRTTIRITHAARPVEDRPEIAGLMAAFRDWKRRRPVL
jgi:anti-sigma factor RsiW